MSRPILKANRKEAVSACVRQQDEISLLKDFKRRCHASGVSVQATLLSLVRAWMYPHE
ncbi:hypothetical protein OAL66_01805 [bacterium]|nr:hypothetical protein [bacterium]